MKRPKIEGFEQAHAFWTVVRYTGKRAVVDPGLFRLYEKREHAARNCHVYNEKPVRVYLLIEEEK